MDAEDGHKIKEILNQFLLLITDKRGTFPNQAYDGKDVHSLKPNTSFKKLESETYLGINPIRLSKSLKRGSSRKGSKEGSTSRYCN